MEPDQLRHRQEDRPAALEGGRAVIEEEGPPILGCMPTNLGAAHIPTATKDSCSECEQEVWVAPSGREIIAEKGALILCIKCLSEKIREDGDPKLEPLTEMQHEEIARYGGDDNAR